MAGFGLQETTKERTFFLSAGPHRTAKDSGCTNIQEIRIDYADVKQLNPLGIIELLFYFVILFGR